MTVDIRCDCTCDLGPIISGGISDDHVQDSWLIKTRGTLVIDGVITPAKGKLVRLAYSRGGYVAPFPRVLTVLRFTADPHRRVTTVEVGCPLTLHEDLKERQLITAIGDTPSWYGGSLTGDNAPPVSANSLMLKCLLALGLPLALGSLPLQSYYMRDSYDLGDGYVTVLRRLLESESRFGYVTAQGEFYMNRIDLAKADPGPLFGWRDLASIEPIGGAVAPVEKVEVLYQGREAFAGADETFFPSIGAGSPQDEGAQQGSNRDDQRKGRDWERDTYSLDPVRVDVPYKGKAPGQEETATQVASFFYVPEGETTTQYQTNQTRDQYTGELSLVDIVVNRKEKVKSCIAKDNATYIRWLLEKGLQAPGSAPTEKRNETEYKYQDTGNGPVVAEQITREYVSGYEFIGSLGVFDYTDVSIPGDTLKSVTIVQTELIEATDTTKTKTIRFLAWGATQQGEQISAAVATNGDAEEINIMVGAAAVLVQDGQEIRTYTGRGNPQFRPSKQELLADSSFGPRVLKSASVSFSLPSDSDSWEAPGTFGAKSNSLKKYIPASGDDWFSVPDGDTVRAGGGENAITNTTLERSGATDEARRYAVTLNALLYGHAHGRAVVGDPWRMPTTPLTPIFISEGGLVAMFRVNGTSWAISNNGLAVGTDALFCGAAAQVVP